MTLLKIKNKCVICGATQEFETLATFTYLRYANLDARRRTRGEREPIVYEIQRCGKCQYANNDIGELVNEVSADVVKTRNYLSLAKTTAPSDMDEAVFNAAISYLLAAKLYEPVDADSEGTCYLKAAWAFDDCGLEKDAASARKKAIECFEKDFACNKDETLAFLLIDLYRRIGCFEEAAKRSRELLEKQTDKNSHPARVLRMQIVLSVDKDTDACSMSDLSILEKLEATE
jgi:uncharacterized protein (DUF2225 family)